METTLRVLIIEDNETDAELVLRQISRSGFTIISERVEIMQQMQDALSEKVWDLVISDYSLPQFDAHIALNVLKETGLDIPFIVVSGNIGEETAVALMKAGANDYLMKDNLARLGPAVQRELAETKNRRDRKKAEELLRESENKYRKIFESIQDVFYQIDASGKILEISPSIIRYSGYLREELIGRQAEELYYDPADRETLLKIIAEKGDVFDFDVRLKSKTNEIKWTSINAKFFFDAEGKPAGVEGSLRDITQRRQSEENLKSSETKFRAIFQNSVDAIGVALRGELIFVNPAFVTIFGYNDENEFISKPILDLIALTQRPKITEYIRLRTTNQPAPANYETQGLRKDGSGFDMEVNVSLYELGGDLFTLFILRDITEKKQAEIALATKEQQLSTLINTTTDIICFKDGEGRWLQANKADLELFGLTGVDYHHKKDSELAEFTNPIYRNAFLSCEVSDEKSWNEGKIINTDEIIPTIDGVDKTFSVAKTPVFNPDGSRKGLVVFARDISERKKIEEAVIESRQQLLDIIDFLPDATFVIDNDMKVIAWNKAMEEMTGITKETMIGQGDHAYTVPFYGDRRLQLLDLLDVENEELKARYQNVQRKGNKLIGEIFAPALYGGKGAYIWNTGAPLFDSNGNRIGSIESIRDVTDRKHIEKNLQENEEKYHKIVDLSPDAIIIHTQGKIVFANPATLKMIGATSPDQIINKPAINFVHPDYRESTKERINKIFESGLPAELNQEKFIKLNGEIIDVDVIGIPINYEGKPAIQTVIRDITARKIAEEAILNAEKRFRAIIENAPDGVVLIDFDGKIKFASPAARTMFGYTTDDPGQIDPITATHPEDTPVVLAALSELIQNPSKILTLQYRFQHKQGSWRWIESTFSNLYAEPGVEAIIINFRDITDRKNAEQVIRENEEKFRLTIENSPLGISITKITGELTVNKAFCSMLGYEVEELSNKTWQEITHHDDIEYSLEFFNSLIEDRKKTARFEKRYLKKDGSIVLTEVNTVLQRDTEGKPMFFITSVTDITERRSKEEKLRQLSKATEQSPASIVITNIHGDIEYVNPKFTQITGYTLEEAIGNTPRILKSGQTTDTEYAHLWETITSGKEWYGEFKNKKKNGEFYYESAVLSPITNDSGTITHFIAVKSDITERKLTEKTLRESEERFRHISSSISDISYSCTESDGTLQIDWMLGATEHILGYSIPELIALKCWGKLVYDEDYPLFREHILNVKPDESDYCHLRMNHKNGSIVWVLATAECIIKHEGNSPKYLFGGLVDITESKQAEDAILQERILLRTLIDNLPDTIYVKDSSCRKLIANRADIEIIGCESENDILGKTDLEIFNNEIGQRGYADDLEVITSRKPVINREENFFDAQGNQRWLLTSKIPLLDKQGQVYGLVGLGHDITGRKLAEQARQESEHNYQQLFENITQSFALHQIILDAAGQPVDYRYLSVNPAFEKLLNVKASEIIGKTVKEIMPHTEQFWIDRYGKVALTGEAVHFEDFSAELGKYFEVWAFSPGESQFAVVFTDISERKRSEQIQKVLYNISNAMVSTSHLEELIGIIREQLGTLLDTTNFFIALYDENTGMLKSPFTSDQKDTITTWSAEKSLTGFVIKNNKSLLVTRAKKEEMRLAGEIELIGTPSEVWLGVPLHLDGKVIGAFAVQSYDNPNAYNERDVEMLEFVSHQISISIQRKKTEDDIKDALIKAEESDKLKTAFLNNMSHEIRTPLNGIMGFSGLLDESGITSEERQYYTRIIHQNGNQLTSIIEAIINIATIEAGLDEIHENPINVNSLLNSLFNSFSMLVDQQSVLLNYKTNLTYVEAAIFTDENKLRQILSNLIGNSVKFTNSGKIEFGCYLKNGFLEFYVSDTGIGIKPEDHEVIFERFRKINPDRSREYGGNGLGLTISKAYIELLGGKIWLESTPGKGSTFYFTTPYRPQATIVVKDQPVIEVPVEKTKIKTLLVAEDEYSNYQLLEVILLREKHRIIHVVNGIEAVEACRENPAIDMVLMDLKMPEMDGFQATTIIKSERPDLPIIAVTAFALSGDKEKALAAGCNEYISKPIKRSDLVEIINKY